MESTGWFYKNMWEGVAMRVFFSDACFISLRIDHE